MRRSPRAGWPAAHRCGPPRSSCQLPRCPPRQPVEAAVGEHQWRSVEAPAMVTIQPPGVGRRSATGGEGACSITEHVRLVDGPQARAVRLAMSEFGGGAGGDAGRCQCDAPNTKCGQWRCVRRAAEDDWVHVHFKARHNSQAVVCVNEVCPRPLSSSPPTTCDHGCAWREL